MSASVYNLWDKKVTAIQLLTDDIDDPTANNATEVAEFCSGEAVVRYNGADKSYGVSVEFLGDGNVQHAFFSDYVVKDIGGGFRVYDADWFQSTYRQNNSDSTFTDIAPECFTDGDVISYKGQNFYRACDFLVTEEPEGAGSYCVKRVNHPSGVHEDYIGRTKVQS